MKKILLGLMALFLAGCAVKVPDPITMPVDVNPSKALKFARAMNLRLIKDEGKSYLIYNKVAVYNNFVGIDPYTDPVRIGETGTILTSTDDAVFSATAGLLTNSVGLGVVDFLTTKRAGPVPDGVFIIGSWNTLNDKEQESKDINKIMWKYYYLMNKKEGLCNSKPGADMSSVIITKQPSVNKIDYVPINFEELPRPPINTSGTAKLFGAGICFQLQVQRADNLPVIQKMSTELGPERAIFVPGSPEHEPVVYHNGEALYFRK